MQLGIYTIGNRYSFSLDNFSSNEHFYLTANIKSSYKYAWQAYSDARRLAMSTPSHIEAIKKQAAQEEEKEEDIMEISAEEMVHQHYDSIYSIIEERSKGDNKKKENDVIYGEIKGIVEEILKILEQLKDEKAKEKMKEVISKFRQLVKQRFPDHLSEDISEQKKKEAIGTPPPSPSNPEEQYDTALPDSPVSKAASVSSDLKRETDEDFSLEIVEDYAQRVCKAIEKKHPSAIYHISKDNSIIILDSLSKAELLKIQMNDELNVNSVYPLGNIADIYPSHSKEFYQRYWKPIVESVGHYALSENNIIYGNFPDIPEDKKDFRIKAAGNNVLLRFGINIWELKSDLAESMDIASKENIKKPGEYTEDDFKEDTIVECIVPELKSIFGKKGIVVQVIPLQSHIELDIQFLEKDNGIKRLTTDQIKIVNV